MARRDIVGAVDFAYLERFAAGDQAVVDEVLALFRHQAELWLRLLDPRAGAEGWRDGAHSLKGAALGIGAHELAEACDAAEAASGADAGRKAVLLDHVRDALDRVQGDIAAYAHERALQSLRRPAR